MIHSDSHDSIWEHFSPLWAAFQEHAASEILIAGGYGLYLKQLWLKQNPEIRTVIPLVRWRDVSPRVTKDLDLVIAVDLIANESRNKGLLGILLHHGFRVSEQPQGKRWQFIKMLERNAEIVVELHAETPRKNQENVATDRVRVKHLPSLKDEGVHGRHNPEAIGSQLHQFEFELGRSKITVPNPLTWSIMKLVALRDRWDKSQDQLEDAERRDFSRIQAIKHGQDVCRTIAMMTEEERNLTNDVLLAVKHSSHFKAAAQSTSAYFTGKESWATQILSDKWNEEDILLIQDVLKGWFSI